MHRRLIHDPHKLRCQTLTGADLDAYVAELREQFDIPADWIFDPVTVSWLHQPTVHTLYSVSDGLIVKTGFWPCAVPAGHALLQHPSPLPDPRLMIVEAGVLRSATTAEIDTYDAIQLSTRCHATSRQKDILAMCGTIARYKNITGWNAMTLEERIQATLKAADIFKAIRELIDDKV